MKQITERMILPVLLLFLVMTCETAGQEQKQTDTLERETIIAAARQVMREARYCTLTTIGEDGHPQSRIVDPFAHEKDMTVWIGTNPITRKVAQIRNDPRATLCYFDPESLGFVTIVGRAELIDDPVVKAKYWKEEWAPLYTDGSSGDDYLLIRVTPLRLEIVSYSQGLPNDPVTWAHMSVSSMVNTGTSLACHGTRRGAVGESPDRSAKTIVQPTRGDES